jgi:hypothetical protein
MNHIKFLLLAAGAFVVMTFAVIGCNNDNGVVNNDNNQNDKISLNLSKNGEIEPTRLIGVWDCVKFAHTKDGNIISDIAVISKGELTIPVAPTPIEENVDDRWHLKHSNDNFYICSLSNNLINLTLKGSTFMMSPPEEEELLLALANAYSFVIKGNELIIYFTGAENKNLLILEKRFL